MDKNVDGIALRAVLTLLGDDDGLLAGYTLLGKDRRWRGAG